MYAFAEGVTNGISISFLGGLGLYFLYKIRTRGLLTQEDSIP